MISDRGKNKNQFPYLLIKRSREGYSICSVPVIEFRFLNSDFPAVKK